jgi:hypothetical protein
VSARPYSRLLDGLSSAVIVAAGERLSHSVLDPRAVRAAVGPEVFDEAERRSTRVAMAHAIEAVSAFLTQVVDMGVGEGECDLLGTEPDEVDSLREFAHFRRLCGALELGGLAGAVGDVRPGLFERFAACLHEGSSRIGRPTAATGAAGGPLGTFSPGAGVPTVEEATGTTGLFSGARGSVDVPAGSGEAAAPLSAADHASPGGGPR